MINAPRKSARCLLFACLMATLPAPSTARAELWENIAAELAAIATAPLRGGWADYLLAAGLAGGTVLALQHDPEWYSLVQTRRTPWQDKVMPPISLLGDGFVEIAGCAALYKFGSPQDQAIASMAIEGQVQVALISTVIKYATSTTRPNDRVDPRQWFVFGQWDSSFPSGHTMSAFCLAHILGRSYHAEWAAYPAAALVAYSRTYNSHHWPADIIAGAGLGILIGEAVLYVHQNREGPASFFFSAYPAPGGGGVNVSWAF